MSDRNILWPSTVAITSPFTGVLQPSIAVSPTAVTNSAVSPTKCTLFFKLSSPTAAAPQALTVLSISLGGRCRSHRRMFRNWQVSILQGLVQRGAHLADRHGSIDFLSVYEQGWSGFDSDSLSLFH